MAEMLTVPVFTRDQIEMAHCAVRYCLGRMTYIVTDGCRWARLYAPHNEWFREQVIRDIEDAERMNSLGMECDAREWQRVLVDLQKMRPS